MKKIVNYLFVLWVQSQIWVALCLSLLAYFFQLIHGWYYPELILLNFFATLLAYNFAYAAEETRLNYRWWVIIVSALFSLWFFFKIKNITIQLLLILSGIISILYSVPWDKYNLRKIPGIKIGWIALVWTATILLPFFYASQVDFHKLIWTGIAVFFFVLGITIPFDMRDLKNDLKSLHTIPQKIGFQKSKVLAMVFLLFSLLCFWIDQSSLNIAFWSYFSSILVGFFLIMFQSKKNSHWYVAFWIEGISALPLIFYILLKGLVL